MIAAVQRVSRASVSVDGELVSEVGEGLLVLLGVSVTDTAGDAAWLARKIAGLRMFRAPEGQPERSVLEIGGEVLAVSQFTLLGNCRKGRRPSFTRAAPGPEAEALYEEFCARLRDLGVPVGTGRFGAMMEVSLVNDGPYTLLVESPGGSTRRGILSASRE
ncbi:MAG: D-tyrosyl-tRNA(Tyr) deacylase [Acidobacteria bacterium]|nr:D-tyrosyl-tRNA(Tyr) deacylase [Acidobacteriota bacterium]MYF15544.1 D-tyrosyl-tRNA(Tyr) deacylase [Acidobacteriota bacterium]MYI96739.1 D-tyrosyl-tRNA(Tyr) deacylase [Acidobacteriota bacterium]